jgi:hypothetical protein
MKKFCSLMSVLFFLFVFSIRVGYAAEESVIDRVSIHLVGGETMIVKPGFSFNAVGIDDYVGVSVRFNGGEWRSFRQEEEDYGDFSSLEFTSPSDRFELLSDDDRIVNVTVMKSYVYQSFLTQAGVLSGGAQSFKVVSRAEWGADESWRTMSLTEFKKRKQKESPVSENGLCSAMEKEFVNQYEVAKTVVRDESGYLRWPLSYSKDVKKLVVHHTAGELKDLNGDGITDQNDYSSVVKAIYKFHTFTRGWGDIGYHYLVDPLGNVYEGRAGGDKVVGAHVLCQNTSTVGVAVLGNFEKGRPSVASFMGLARILQQQSLKYEVNPLGKSQFRGAILPHIVGHNAVGALTKEYIGQGGTTCPGKNLDRMLSQLREVVASGSFDGAPLGFIPYKEIDFQVEGALNNQLSSVSLEPVSDYIASVTLRNLGFREWTHVELVPRKTASQNLAASPVGISTRVQTGGSLSLTLSFSSGIRGGRFTVPYDVKINGDRQSYGILKVPVMVKRPQFSYKVKDMNGFTGSLLTGQTQMMNVTLENTSNFIWKKDGDYQFSLREVGRIGPKVVARRRGDEFLLQQDVPVGGMVTFGILFQAPKKVGDLSKEWLPMIGLGTGLKGSRIVSNIRVERPRFSLTSVSVGKSPWLKKGEDQVVQLGVKNTGNFVWKADRTWIQVEKGEKVKLLKPVAPGEVYTFPFIVRTSYSDILLEVKGAVGNDQYGKKQQLFVRQFRTKGRAFLKALKVGQSESLLENKKGFYSVWVDYKNTGNVPWYRDGKERVELNVQDRMDFFDKDSWVSRKTAAVLTQSRVNPGDIGRFEFVLKVSRKSLRPSEDSFLPEVNGKSLLGRGLEARWSTGVRLTANIRQQGVKNGEREVKKTEVVASVALDRLRAVREAKVKEQGTKKRENEEIKVLESSGGDKPIRVWLKKFQEDKVGSDERLVILGGEDGRVEIVLSDLNGGKVVRVEAKSGGYLEVESWVRSPAWSDALNDNKFRGALELRIDPSVANATSPLERGEKILLINELSLDDYMKGIAEVPEDDEDEKRKVIAVLSRSYAWHYVNSSYRKFPGRPYDAVDDPAVFQKYVGYSFESRSPKWQRALQQTQDEVVKYNGAVLRAPYFSCSNGKTKSLDEAGWSGSEYFRDKGGVFISVDDSLGNDPDRSAKSQCGHGVGVSGLGATNMAKEGNTYRQIINYYYQNVEVGEIE